MNDKSVLVIEDDEFLREIYVDTLKNEGYVVEAAQDGEGGYEKIKSRAWDLVLLDIILPKLSGLEIVKKIKSEQNVPLSKKIIFLTNLDNEQQKKEALELGSGYLIKSQLTPGDLLREVNKVF